MKRNLTKGEVKAELAARSFSIEQRLDSLEQEAVSLKEQVLQRIKDQPYIAAGGALLAGAVVGWIVGRPKKSTDPFDVNEAHQLLVSRYVDAISRDVQRRVAEEGIEAAEATREALRNGVPLIVMPSEDSGGEGGLGGLILTAVKTALAIIVRSSVQNALGSFDLDAFDDTEG